MSNPAFLNSFFRRRALAGGFSESPTVKMRPSQDGMDQPGPNGDVPQPPSCRMRHIWMQKCHSFAVSACAYYDYIRLHAARPQCRYEIVFLFIRKGALCCLSL